MTQFVFFLLAILFAILDCLAVSIWQKKRVLEYIAKPAAMLCLIAWLYSQIGPESPAFLFGVGLVLSLVGDILLLDCVDQFIGAVVAFALAHLFYIIVFARGALTPNLYLLVFVLLFGILIARILKQIVRGLGQKGKSNLNWPVVIYGLVISFMFLFALSTLFREGWGVSPVVFISAGAALFLVSDILLAWNKFVKPIQNERLMNKIAYHFGQIALTVGVILQFT